MCIGKKIKFNNNEYNIKCSSYKNGRMKLEYYNRKIKKEITINVEDAYIKDGHFFLDPEIMNNGLYRTLKRRKIIKEIVGILNNNYIEIPIAQVNVGILRDYDKKGVTKYIDERMCNHK